MLKRLGESRGWGDWRRTEMRMTTEMRMRMKKKTKMN
jgi:hypothetical protein